MKKEYLLIFLAIALIGGILSWEPILAYFGGMSPMEAMQTIWTFVLRVTVGTILAYAAYTLPEIVKPWLKMLKEKQKQARRKWRSGPDGLWRRRTPGHGESAPATRWTAEERALLLLARLNGRGRTTHSAPTSDLNDESQVNIRW